MAKSRYRAGLRALAVIVYAMVIVACDKEQHTSEPEPVEQAEPARDAAPPPQRKEPPVPDEPPRESVAPEALDIDFSIPAGILSGDDDPDYTAPDDNHVLPDLFDTSAKQSKTRINAELFRDEHNPDVIDSIEGMNLTIERELGD